MPPSALDQLARLNIIYPMLFKLTNRQTDRITHCGVLEFVAEEGRVYLPQWVSDSPYSKCKTIIAFILAHKSTPNTLAYCCR